MISELAPLGDLRDFVGSQVIESLISDIKYFTRIMRSLTGLVDLELSSV